MRLFSPHATTFHGPCPLTAAIAPLPAIKELVTDANFQCDDEGIKLQAMDNSHVALVSLNLETSAFKRYRCDHSMPLGVNLAVSPRS